MIDDYYRYCELALADGRGETIALGRLLDERNTVTPVDPWYLIQDVWAFRRVVALRPDWLLDVGSTALLVGILSQVVDVVSVDVRPLPVELPGLTCRKGDITALPFDDGEVPMVTSLSVIEHIGLGRYGDTLDPRGSERACRELQRVVRSGGRIVLSAPVADEPMTVFNMHRLLTREQVCGWLDGCELMDELTIDGGKMVVWCAEFVKG